MPKKVEVSHRTIVFTIFFIIFLWFLFYIRDLLTQIIVAMFLAAVLDPFVSKFSVIKIPRGIAVLLTYILVLGTVSAVIAWIASPLFAQTASFANSLPGYISNLGVPSVISDNLGSEFLKRVGAIPEQILKFSISVLSNVLSLLTVLVFAFYFILTREKLDEGLAQFFGSVRATNINLVVRQIEVKIGNWVRGQLLLMIIVGLMNYVGLYLLGVPFALPLALLAAIFEVVPYLGPIIAGVPAVLIGFGISSYTGFGVLAMALLVQQIENYILVPKIMGKSVGVSPVVILIALAIGQKLAGITGMLISIPVVITLQILMREYFAAKETSK